MLIRSMNAHREEEEQDGYNVKIAFEQQPFLGDVVELMLRFILDGCHRLSVDVLLHWRLFHLCVG